VSKEKDHEEHYIDDDRSHEPGRGKMALARSLPLLVFTLCSVALISIMAIRNYQRFSGSATMFDSTATVCSGIPSPDAAPFTPEDGVHSTVAFYIFSNGLIRADNSYIPEAWQPDSLDQVEWVLCINGDRPAYRALCENDAIVNEYGRELLVTLRVAQTADILAIETITSEDIAAVDCWDELPTQPPPDPESIERVSVEQVEAWLENYSANFGQ